MTENVAAVNLKDNDNHHNLHSLMRIHQKEEKVVTNWVAKYVFNVGEITHILEIAQQKARNAINAKRKVILTVAPL